jgi:hypothetical protein
MTALVSSLSVAAGSAGGATLGARPGAAASGGEALEAVSILALNPSEGRVALGMPDGTMKVARPGDVVSGGAVLKAVYRDKLSVELPSKRNDGSRDIAWMFRTVPPGRGSRVQRFDPVPPPAPPIPVTVTGRGQGLKSAIGPGPR